ncbi:MAG: hypothetical protein KAI18_02870 [Candidatus Aenigmarchaeota archaeon]|nr:hypothetical protein [Candidatus Aenigmarchaeota archaeon]
MFNEKIRSEITRWNSEEFMQALKDGSIETYTGDTTLHFLKKEDQKSPAYQYMIQDNGQKIRYDAAIELIKRLTRKIKDTEYDGQMYQ